MQIVATGKKMDGKLNKKWYKHKPIYLYIYVCH